MGWSIVSLTICVYRNEISWNVFGAGEKCSRVAPFKFFDFELWRTGNSRLRAEVVYQ